MGSILILNPPIRRFSFRRCLCYFSVEYTSKSGLRLKAAEHAHSWQYIIDIFLQLFHQFAPFNLSAAIKGQSEYVDTTLQPSMCFLFVQIFVFVTPING